MHTDYTAGQPYYIVRHRRTFQMKPSKASTGLSAEATASCPTWLNQPAFQRALTRQAQHSYVNISAAQALDLPERTEGDGGVRRVCWGRHLLLASVEQIDRDRNLTTGQQAAFQTRSRLHRNINREARLGNR